MLDQIKIERFRSFREVDLKLPALAVLIGPNGSGKSNFLDLLALFAQAGQGQMADGIARAVASMPSFSEGTPGTFRSN